jgi:hypothetical protein
MAVVVWNVAHSDVKQKAALDLAGWAPIEIKHPTDSVLYAKEILSDHAARELTRGVPEATYLMAPKDISDAQKDAVAYILGDALSVNDTKLRSDYLQNVVNCIIRCEHGRFSGTLRRFACCSHFCFRHVR